MEESVHNGKSERDGKGHLAKGIRAYPSNWLVPVALIALREWNSYGYELMQRAAAFGLGAMNPGTFYRTLRQMEKEGIVKSSWKTGESGPARRMYSITDAGEAYLDFWADALKRYQRNVDAFLHLYRGLIGAPDRREERRRVGE
jgi:poly-beta-hydroxybutyrate-responsive repressor